MRQILVKSCESNAEACGELMARVPDSRDDSFIAAKSMCGIDLGLLKPSVLLHHDVTRVRALNSVFPKKTFSVDAVVGPQLIDLVSYVDRSLWNAEVLIDQRQVHPLMPKGVVNANARHPLTFPQLLSEYLASKKFQSAKMDKVAVESTNAMQFMSQVDLALPHVKENASRVLFVIADTVGQPALRQLALKLELGLAYYACRDEWRRQVFHAEIAPLEIEGHTAACGFVFPHDGVGRAAMEEFITDHRDVLPLVYRAMVCGILFYVEVPPASARLLDFETRISTEINALKDKMDTVIELLQHRS
jgi:hypothetical protein